MALSEQVGGIDLGVAQDKIEELIRKETQLFTKKTERSRQLNEEASAHWLHGLPLHWMNQWASPYPLTVARAKGARLWDVDDNEYIDFCLGDSGALFGHGNPKIAEPLGRHLCERGSTAMLPGEDLAAVGKLLHRNFGLPYWQMAVSATDANRFAIRLARIITGRKKILVFNGKYHGSVDETQVELDGQGAMRPQHGVAPNAVDFDETTRVVEYNDIEALEAALNHRDVACVLTEPMLTNIGMVPPQPGFNEEIRRLTEKTGTLFILDETHTICLGPGGWAGEYGLKPDMLVCGKVLTGGAPGAVYGMSETIAKKVCDITGAPGVNHFGFGGTLAGGFAFVHAMRHTLERVATPDNYAKMKTVAATLEDGLIMAIRKAGVPWHVTRIGARVEYLFRPDLPKNGGEAGAARSDLLEAAMHLYFLNRGILRSPFHNMALVCPFTSKKDAWTYVSVFSDLLSALKN